jgi:hypothetical protein
MGSDKDYNLKVFLDEEGTPPYKGFSILRQRPHFLFEKLNRVKASTFRLRCQVDSPIRNYCIGQ